MLETVVGLQLRVVLGQSKELTEARAQTTLCLAQGADIMLFASTGNGATRCNHPLQRRAFVLHVLLAGFHQLGQFVVSLLEQHVDVRPGLAHAMLEAYQPVVQRHRVGAEQDEDNDDDHGGQAHAVFSRQNCESGAGILTATRWFDSDIPHSDE